MCDAEIEFAADVIPEGKGSDFVLKLLQVRPISQYDEDRNSSVEQISKEISRMVATSPKALGAGRISGMRNIVYLPSEKFDSACTEEIAGEIAAFNRRMKEEGKTYMLIGPGRWGSSDPWLGIPVLWSDISEAKLIVECAIPGFRVEPSQGTHFFQNITSLGVGYLTVDTVSGDGSINEEFLNGLPALEEAKFVRLLELPDELLAFIDRNSGNAVVGL